MTTRDPDGPAPDDDDELFGAVPDDPDAEPSAAELAQARSFAQLVDKSILGVTPPAMSADDRALLDVATVIRAGSHDVALAEPRRRAIVEAALAKAIAAEGPIPIARAPRPRRKVLPWAIAGGSALAAAAAVVLLLVGRGGGVGEAAIPTAWQSRPADALIGPIARERAGDAEARIDTIFADRLDGFRDRTLGGRP